MVLRYEPGMRNFWFCYTKLIIPCIATQEEMYTTIVQNPRVEQNCARKMQPFHFIKLVIVILCTAVT